MTREDKTPKGYVQIIPVREDGKHGNWRWEMDTAKKNIDILIPKFMPNRKIWGIFEKDIFDPNRKIRPTTAWTDKCFNSERGTEQFLELGFDKEIFPRPKPVGLIKRILEFVVQENEDNPIVLDFFAGSSVLAHGVLEYNLEHDKKIKVVSIQLPENCEEDSEAYKEGYKSIADIGKERIRRVIKKLKLEIKENRDLFSKDKSEFDFGFKVFKLKESNFKVWRSDVIEGKEDLGKQLDMFQDPVKPGAEMNNMMWELLVKNGYELTTKVEEREISKCPVQIIADGELVICLSKLTETAVKEILKLKPKKVICIDSLFERNDKLKTNTALQMKDVGVEFKTI
jgi:adenine-specific DNA-methyltransferase